jgi:hypothetical protein
MINKDPLPPDIAERLDRLGLALEASGALMFAYLFGRAAGSQLEPLSDVDIAVYLEDGVDPTDGHLDAFGRASACLGTDEIDVVVLNTAPTALAGRILQTRRILFDKNPFRRHRFESLALREFFDFRFAEQTNLAVRFTRG